MDRPVPHPTVASALTLKNLRTFYWLARYRNYHAVARYLNVTQPAISSRISSLEEVLGVRLFSRDNQSVELTPEGHEALRLTEIVLDNADTLAERFSRSRDPSGLVRIGVVETVARTWLPGLLKALQERYPNIELEITTESTSLLHAMLKSSAISMCVSMAPAELSDVSNEEICRYGMEWVADPRIFDAGHVHTLAELIRLPLIGYLANSPPGDFLDRYFGDAYRDRTVHNSTNSMSTMIWLAENGLGIAAIPPVAVAQHLKDGRLAIIATETPMEPVSFFLNHRTRPLSPVTKAVKALIVEMAESYRA
ncbi:LysR family transcriptional regulator [Rhodobium gokarnense]|uniref:DNA-binding transcriptional LysR family regulator n=1 Tax=Rhodobium gokarnense TaxID=364296 RepID=A0ABT3H6E2_9HYPH|nr:LysR family transcriptional regulator [Rhodobium gokarnense]MCW2305957.1 DNA-binding transcriptional LysR family regulator [Rhodobium gokarnense]